MDKSNRAAGLFREKLGMSEMPLLVAVICPRKKLGVWVVSMVWAKEQRVKRKKVKKVIVFFIG